MTRVVGAILDRGPSYRIRLDWKAYFYRCVEAHGEPVARNRSYLLFRDGWQYAIGDYQGPEFAPPSNIKKLQALKREYWEILRAKLQNEYECLGTHITVLQDWDKHRDMPLQQSVIYESRSDDGVIKSVRSEGEDLDLAPLHAKIRDLQHLLGECDENLATYNEGN